MYYNFKFTLYDFRGDYVKYIHAEELHEILLGISSLNVHGSMFQMRDVLK